MERKSMYGPLGVARFWLGMSILVATILAISALTRHAGATEARVLIAACIGAFGTLACAYLSAPVVRYPRRAYWTAAILMAGGILASVITAGTPRVWADETRDIVWMVPWFFLFLGMIRTPERGACPPESRIAGRLLIVTGVVYCAILQLPAVIHRG